MDFIDETRRRWELYLHGDETGSHSYPEDYATECVIIGTGRDEVYRSRDEFFKELARQLEEHQEVPFEIKRFTCSVVEISPEVVLTYGVIYVWWESQEDDIVVDMDSRYSLVYKKDGDTWKTVLLHQSIPYIEQQEGEFYPKTLTEQLRREKQQEQELAWLAERDNLTGLFNYRTFESRFAEMQRGGEWLFIADLDDFKSVNDVYGHLTGNHVLQLVANNLLKSVSSEDLVCRMGGDEFVLLCEGTQDEKHASAVMDRIRNNLMNHHMRGIDWKGISIGGTMIRPDEPLDTAFKRADSALYMAKASGKNKGILAM